MTTSSHAAAANVAIPHAAVRAAYRNVLRAVPHAVRQSRPSTSNMRRLLRDDVRHAAAQIAGPPQDGTGTREVDGPKHVDVVNQTPADCWAAMQQRVRRTLLLLLSSSSRGLSRPGHTSGKGAIPEKTSAPPEPASRKRPIPTFTVPNIPRRYHYPTVRVPEGVADTPAARRAAALAVGEHRLSHDIVANAASLAYHHVRPFDRMQPLERSRRFEGGTFTAQARRQRARRNAAGPAPSPSRPSVEAAEVGDFGARGSGTDKWDDATEPIPSLVVLPKPPRGPVTRRANLAGGAVQGGGGGGGGGPGMRWDGQKKGSLDAPPDTGGVVADDAEALEAKEQEVRARFDALRAALSDAAGEEAGGTSAALPPSRDGRRLATETSGQASKPAAPPPPTPIDPRLAALRDEAKRLRGLAKARRRADAAAGRAAAQRQAARRLLLAVVARAERASGAYLGGTRWAKWAKGQWLD